MRRSVLLALTVTCLVLAAFMFFSQRYRHADMDTGTEPLLAASAVPTISPLASPLVEASYLPAAPFVEFRQPAGEMLLNNHPIMYLVFDQSMDQESVRSALTVDPPVALVTTWLRNTLYIQPTSTLRSATEYRFALDTGARSQSGVALAEPYRWRYRSTTAAVAPVLVTEPTPVILLAFDGPVKPVDFQLDPPLRTTHRWLNTEANTAGSGGSNQLAITPQEPLWPETDYQLRFAKPLLTIQGDPVSLPPLTVHTPPPTVAYSPYDSTVENPLTPISVNFTPLYAELLNRQATAATLQISPTVTGTTTWDGTTLTFTPDAGYFAPRSLYQVAISPVLSDSRRAPTGTPVYFEPITWHFETFDFSNWANFGYGSKVQALAPSGPRTIKFQRNGTAFPFDPYSASPQPTGSGGQWPGRAPTTVDFVLYPLSTQQFQQMLAREMTTYGQIATGFFHPGDLAPALERWSVPLLSPTEQNSPLNPSSDDRQLTTQLPAAVPPGSYLLSLETGYINDQLLLLVSDYALTLKESRREILLWVSQLSQQGHPLDTIDGVGPPTATVANMPVTLWSAAGEQLFSGVTDKNGFLRAAFPHDPPPFFAIAYQPADDAPAAAARPPNGAIIAAAGATTVWRSADSRWPQLSDGSVTPPTHAVYLSTERPLYQPGQTVYFKGIVRTEEDAALTLPAVPTAVTVRVRDAQLNVVRTFDVDTNEFGTFHGELPLAEGAMLGTYQLEAEIQGEIYRQPFGVESYVKPDYVVDMTVAAPDLFLGAPVTVTVDSHYLNGAPLVGAQVTLHHFLLGQAYGLAGPLTNGQWMNTFQTQTGTTDDSGRAHMIFAVGNGAPSRYELNGYRGWMVEATVTDAAGQSAVAYHLIEGTDAALQFSLGLTTTTILPNTLLELHIRSHNSMGAPDPYARMRLDLLAQQGPDRAAKGLRPVAGLVNADLVTDGAGELQLPVRLIEPGYYQLQLTHYDAKGYGLNPFQQPLLVYDPDQPWLEEVDGFLALVAPTQPFTPDEAVPLQIYSSFSGPALLTLERGVVRRTVPLQLTAPLTEFALPLQIDDAPNLYLTLHAWTPTVGTDRSETDRDGTNGNGLSQSNYRLRTATAELTVTPVNKRLSVTVTADHSSYAPREEATLTIHVQDEEGNLARAELSVAVVDEAIYQLSGDLSADLYATFYGKRPLGVATFDSMAPVRTLGNYGYGGGGGGFAPENPRQDFPDTAYWLPAFTTDDEGTATVKVALPDTVTSWRAVVKAVTTATQVGEGTVALVTAQALTLDPVLPNALTVGDSGLLSLRIHNQLATTETVTVTLALSGTLSGVADIGALPLQLTDPTPQQLLVAPGATATIGWSVEAIAAGEASLLFSAAGAHSRDAIRLPLTIHPHAIRDVTTAVGQFTTTWTTTITVPTTVPELSLVRLDLSRSAAGSMLEGVEYLTGYPYGCVEQTMSRALPNAVVARAFRQLGIGDPATQRALPAQINAGLQRLYNFQTGNGGWGWWENDVAAAYQSAWVVFGLAQTAEAGFEVDQTVLDRGLGYLLQNHWEFDPPSQAFALYVISLLAPDNAVDAMLALAKRADQLDPFGQAALALALQRNGETAAAQQLLALLAAGAVTDDEGVHWPVANPDGTYERKAMASATRSTALALRAFLAIQPEDTRIPAIVRWLMARRQVQGWGTTNETAFTILALTDYLLVTGASEPTTPYAVLLNGAMIGSGTIDALQPSVQITLTAAQLTVGTNALRITTDEGTPLYYRLVQQVYRPEGLAQGAGSLTVTRRYLDPQSGEELSTATVGQLVQVELTVQIPKALSYVLIEDRLPGGLVALNERLGADSQRALAQSYPYYSDEVGYNHKEIRGERVTFFVTEMEPGLRQVSYFARAVMPGQFMALPAEAYAMYDFATWGRSAGQSVQVFAE